MKFLNSLYEDIDNDLKSRYGVGKFREDYISSCLTKIESIFSEYLSFEKKDKEDESTLLIRKIENCLKLLVHQLEGQSYAQNSGFLNLKKPITLIIKNSITKEDIFGSQTLKFQENGNRVSNFLVPYDEDSWKGHPLGIDNFHIKIQ